MSTLFVIQALHKLTNTALQKTGETMCRCKLCLQEKPLKESHIISKLFFKALKKRSEDSSFRDLSVPNRRIQDGIKVNLLCNDCEEKFSKFETYYSNRFLKNISDENISINTNDDNLRYFLLSLHWRLLVWKTLNDNIMMDNMNVSEKKAFFDVLELWRKALDSEDYDTIRSIRMRLCLSSRKCIKGARKSA